MILAVIKVSFIVALLFFGLMIILFSLSTGD